MGVDRRALEALLHIAKQHDLGSVAMIGRLGMPLKARTIRRIFREFGRYISADEIERARETGYAEQLLKQLRASSVDSFDASDYENANKIADLSRPIPKEWHGQYDTVLDFGTLEHIFHFPQAIENCFLLLKPGGKIVSLNGANNYCGHGFYQFSPELWFSLFAANNYRDVEIYLVPARPDPLWFKVSDPRDLGERVEVINAEQLYVLAIASKPSDAPAPMKHPQQSDYANLLWRGRPSASIRRSPSGSLARGCRAVLGAVLKGVGRGAVPAFGVSDNPRLTRFDPRK